MSKWIAHRGLKEEKKEENTLPAFARALASFKYAGFECDIRSTKDNVFVVCHDPVWHSKIISVTDSKELKGIVLLEDVLKLKSDKIFLLEIKELQFPVALFLELLAKYPHQNLYIMSFYNRVIKKIPVSKSYRRGLLNYVLNSEEDYEEYEFICLLEAISTPKLVSFFERQNKTVFIYGIHHLQQTSQTFTDCYLITDE